jgi:hypothetical protein
MVLCAYWYWFGRFFTNKELEALDGIDKVEILVVDVSNGNVRSVKVIDNSQEIQHIVAKLRTYSDHWQYEKFSPPWTGILGRLAPVNVVFYSKGELKALVRVGYSKDFPYYLSAVQEGRYLDYEDFKEIIELLGFEEQVAYYE